MGQIVILLTMLTAQEPAPASLGDIHASESSKAEAGNDPAKLVKLALWCEVHGMRADRRAALERAIRLESNGVAAHGFLGQVLYQGRWEPHEAVRQRMNEDAALTAKLAEYNARREHIHDGFEFEEWEIGECEKKGDDAGIAAVKISIDHQLAQRHVKLGIWCEMKGLKPEALAHFTTAVLLNPHDQVTWRHLGYTKYHGRWMTRGQIAADQREAVAQKHADRVWEPLLRKWAAQLDIPDRRDSAEANLAKITDPRAVPSIVRVFGNGSAARQMVAVRLLKQIDAPSSTDRLASLAVYNDEPDVRQAAATALRGREPRDYAGRLVDMIRPPVTYDVQSVEGPGTQGSLVIDSHRFRITRTYDAPPAFRLHSTFYGYIGYDPNGLPVVVSGLDLSRIQDDFSADTRRIEYFIDAESRLRAAEVRTAVMLATAQMRAREMRERLAADVAELEESSALAKVLNPRIKEALQLAMDAPSSLTDNDDDAWHSWYYERIGYRFTPAPKIVVARNMLPPTAVPAIVSCFAAGTPVRTLDGPRPIESLKVGDQVLSLDVSVAALAFRPVVAVHHNPPDKTLRVALENGDAVVASRFHRFWLAGRGWAMARDLKPGDVLRTLSGLARITSVEQAPVQPVFNLDVAESRTYFVGNAAMLVHDNTLPPPRANESPFDAISAPSSPVR